MWKDVMLLCRVLFFCLRASFSRACIFAFDNILFSVVDFAAGDWNIPLHICGVHTCDFDSYVSVFFRYSSSGDSRSFDLWWLFVWMTEMQCMFVEVIALVHMCPVIIYWKQENLLLWNFVSADRNITYSLLANRQRLLIICQRQRHAA